MARRYLNFEIDEWRALPWWKQRVYLEGLKEEAPWEKQGCAMAEGSQRQPFQGDGGEDLKGDDALRQFGINVQNVQAPRENGG